MYGYDGFCTDDVMGYVGSTSGGQVVKGQWVFEDGILRGYLGGGYFEVGILRKVF